MDKVNDLIHKVKIKLDTIPVFQKIEDVVGVPKLYLVAGASIILFFCMIMNFGGEFICTIVGFSYPTYASLKALSTLEKTDDQLWLSYWITYALFHVIEIFGSFITYHIPFYYGLKMGILIFCFLPQTKGALFIYKNIIRPFFLGYEKNIDSAFTTVKTHGASVLADVSGAVGEISREAVSFAAQKVTESQTRNNNSKATKKEI